MTIQALLILLALLIAHWLADFVLQSHHMASNKGKDNYVLTTHVAIYSAVMWLAACVLVVNVVPGEFALFLFATHWATDYFTSRLTSKLWAHQDWHNFFVVVGLDQLFHHVQIFFAAAVWIKI